MTDTIDDRLYEVLRAGDWNYIAVIRRLKPLIEQETQQKVREALEKVESEVEYVTEYMEEFGDEVPVTVESEEVACVKVANLYKILQVRIDNPIAEGKEQKQKA